MENLKSDTSCPGTIYRLVSIVSDTFRLVQGRLEIRRRLEDHAIQLLSCVKIPVRHTCEVHALEYSHPGVLELLSNTFSVRECEARNVVESLAVFFRVSV